MNKVYQHNDFGLAPDAGLPDELDPTDWAYARLYLNPHARQLYLWLREQARRGRGHIDLREAVNDIGSDDGKTRYEGRGPVSRADMRQALIELDAAGLTRTDADDGEAW